MAVQKKWTYILFITLFLLPSKELVAQMYQGDDVIAQYREGEVYLFHMAERRIDHGIHIYRAPAGSDDFERITDTPVRASLNPDQFRNLLGERYDEIRRNAEAATARSLMSELNGNSQFALLYPLLYREVGLATGRLFIDQELSDDQEWTYRVDVVNQRDEPTGEQHELTVEREQHSPGTPQITNVENEGDRVTIEWDFDYPDDELTVRFDLLKQVEGESLQRVTRDIILFDREVDDHQFGYRSNHVGEEIEYRIVAVNIVGIRGEMSPAFAHEVVDNVAPGVVNRVRTTLDDDHDEIQVQWQMSPELDVAGYHVYRSTDPQGKDRRRVTDELVPISDPLYFDDDIEEGMRYHYQVTAVDESGNESEKSNTANRLVPDQTPPPAPIAAEGEYDHDNQTVTLNWETEPLPEDFRNFRVLKRIQSGRSSGRAYRELPSSTLRQTTITDRGTGDAGFEEGATYRYGIIAADSSRNFSDTTFVDVQIPNLTPPEEPASVRARNREGVRVLLNWEGSLSRDVDQYRIYRRSTEGDFTPLTEIGAESRSYRDEEITVGEEYIYAIAAIDSSGNESGLKESGSVLVDRQAPPRRVRNVIAVESDNQVRVRWEPVSSSVLDGYRVYTSSRSTGRFTPLNDDPIDETELQVDPDSDQRWFRVVAVDITGNESRPSEPSRIIKR